MRSPLPREVPNPLSAVVGKRLQDHSLSHKGEKEKALASLYSANRATRRAAREMTIGRMKDVALTPASPDRAAAAATTTVVGTRAELPELYGESPPKTGDYRC